ncbi:M1 family metallopeptidase [Lactobacillus sp. ESL0681]|uniref:M1 family metallopeptidase n=1 Tax=Lactobacillus sp. ESL0681 TaxID=2983211 RepID=UPI0023FA4314|nr:M1 family metallopeptidase [Lactobacillus sp. ESL0681]WEV39938.1 M1 family metallopeptidase [Lactobacillus sp. ESL0681]
MAAKHFYETFQPDHYDLFIDIDREKKTITGTSTITGEAVEETIFINQKFMNIISVKEDDRELPFTVDDDKEAIVIDLGHSGQVTVAVAYSAPLTDTMMGIYPSYYMLDGVKKQIIGTQFETTSARQAFPCVDEPEAKATFTLALKYDEHPGEVTIANMPEAKVEDGVHYFAKSVRMSTYLVAFAFGELQSKLTETKDGVQVGVFATKAHQPKELDFALDIAKRSIEFYEEFYQTKYPLPHSWQLALPDFSAGAMENWGLVTYREAAILLDPDNATVAQKGYVATVIAHELAHQWFGDLVTMKWWDDLWLNESFANMMMYLSIDAIEPDWHVWDNMYQTGEVPMALNRDATDGVQSVHVEVEHPADIDSLFDSAIVYAKGSRMLVMVRKLLGDDALRAGLKYYFEQHQYGNATGDDLWNALSTATDLDIGEIMHTWLDQPGYPVVIAKVADNGHLILEQQQFFAGEGEDKGRLWAIPLNANFEAPKIMTKAEVDLGNYQKLRENAGHALRLNVGNSSHFIVNYDETLMSDIMTELNELTAVDQLQLLQDLGLLAEGKQVSYAEIVPLLPKFANSKSNIVINSLFDLARKLRKFVTPASIEEKNLKQFFNQLSHAQVARLGWEAQANDSMEDLQMRPLELSAALYAENQAVIATGHQIFNDYQSKLASLDAAIRPYVLMNEVKNYARTGLVEQLIKEYQAAVDPYYKEDLLSAITSTKDEQEIDRIIADFGDADVIKPQDLRSWYYNVLAEPKGQQAAWDWLRDKWSWLEQTVGGDMSFTSYITVTARVFHTPERLAEFKAFFEPKINQPGLGREIQMDTRSIATKVDLIEHEKTAVNEAIKTNLAIED